MAKTLIWRLLIFLCCIIVSELKLRYIIVPDVTVEALKNGSFRVYIPDSRGIQNFAVHANINEPISVHDLGTFFMDVKEKTGKYWIAHFPDAHVEVGDNINFWIFCLIDNYNYTRGNLNVTIIGPLDSYPLLKSTKCVKAVTILNGKETCKGDVILDEQFSSTTINSSNWIVEHWIPIYTPPNFIFNSYLNTDDTRFIVDGILHLKPIVVQNDSETRGVLDLRNGCTSQVVSNCLLQSKAWFLLPPVHSAKITSRTSFKYGKIDIIAKLPAGEWLVPVIRLEQQHREGLEKNSSEIWIAYSRGNEHLNGNGEDIGAQVLYAGPVLYQTVPNISQLVSKHSSVAFNQQFHKYSLEWTPGKMTFGIDGFNYGSVDVSKDKVLGALDTEFNREYVLSLGVAVGGLNNFPDGYISENNPKPWEDTSPKALLKFLSKKSIWSRTWVGSSSALQVDYVKITAI